ncbi:MAG: recombinase family protein [Lachnospiraceae bacterium]|nr:recombinase family protein [Lachnospiraceae bacterium]
MARTSRKTENVLSKNTAFPIKAALYVRLSNEDNGGKGTDSIHNQLELLLNFAEGIENIEIVETYTDNGRTGTDFDRPEWERMLQDVKAQRVNCIIVKDLSRFARNYLEAGDYLEKIFPFLGVRFIAVNDQFDSEGVIFKEKDLITEFKNIANDYYAKDISKKIMASFNTKKGQGQFIGSMAPYGYILQENHFIIDEPAAAVVRRIFSMKMQGKSFHEIAKVLNQEEIPSPSRYAGERGVKKYKGCDHILWQPQAVSRILYNRVYVGDLVQGKYNRSIYSKEKQGKRKEEVWEIDKDAHPAIVDRESFDSIQKIREKNRKTWQDKQGETGYENILEGILVCGICHHVLRRNKDVRKGKAQYYFYCGSAYNYSQVKCDTSSIADYKIFDTVFQQIKLQIDLAVEAKAVIEQMKKSSHFASQLKRKKQERVQAKEELGRYIYLKTNIYEDMKQGILTKEEFLVAKEKYALRIAELEEEVNKKEKELEDFEQCMNGSNRWMKAFLHFQGAEELTRDMAVELLEKVEMFGDKRVHIKFRFRNEYDYLMSQIETEEKKGSDEYGREICS